MMLGLWESEGSPEALHEWCCGALNWVSVFTGKLKTDYLEHYGEMTSFSFLARDESKKPVSN